VTYSVPEVGESGVSLEPAVRRVQVGADGVVSLTLEWESIAYSSPHFVTHHLRDGARYFYVPLQVYHTSSSDCLLIRG